MTWAIEEKNYSQARARALIGLAPKTYRYRAKRGADVSLSVVRVARELDRIAELAVGLRYVDTSDGVRSVCLLPERKRQFTQPTLQPVRLNFGKILPVNPWGMGQDVIAADLVVQHMEPVTGFTLLFALDRFG